MRKERKRVKEEREERGGRRKRESGEGKIFHLSISGVQLTDGSSGPLVSPLSVIWSGVLAKGAKRTRGSREYPMDRCRLQSCSNVPPTNRPGE